MAHACYLCTQKIEGRLREQERGKLETSMPYETFEINTNILKRNVYLPTCARCTSGVVQSAGKALHQAPGWNGGAAILLA